MTADGLSPGAARRERPAGPELARIHDALFAARHEEADVEWADRAFVHMGFAAVRLDQVELLLSEVAAAVRASQEGPQDLFGDPTDWADERMRELRESGLDVFEDSLLMGPREFTTTTFGLASGLSALFFLSQLLDLVLGGEEGPTGLSPGFAVLPLLIAAALMLLITVFKRATPRFRFPVVIALCAGTVVLASAGIAGILVPLAQSGLEAGWLWTILLVPLYAVLAWTIATLWRAPKNSSPPPLTMRQILDSADLNDSAWVQRARAALRHRGDLSDARIDAALDEARGHAADSGSSLLGEFGSPEGYAQKLPRDRATIPRRMTLFYAVLAVLWLVLAVVHASDAHWTATGSLVAPAALMLLCAGWAVGSARAWRREVHRASRASA